MSTEQAKINQAQIEEAMKAIKSDEIDFKEQLVLQIATALVANNHMLAKMRGEVIKTNDGQGMNELQEMSMIGYRAAYLACALFEGMHAGNLAFKLAAAISEKQEQEKQETEEKITDE